MLYLSLLGKSAFKALKWQLRLNIFIILLFKFVKYIQYMYKIKNHYNKKVNKRNLKVTYICKRGIKHF